MNLRHLILTAAFLLSSLLPLSALDQDLHSGLELFGNRLYFLAHEKLMKLTDEPSRPDIVEQAYYHAAQSSFFLRQYKNAISEFTSLLINFPNTPFAKNAKYHTALSYSRMGNYTYAIKSLKNYVAEFPGEKANPGIQLLMAECYLYLEYYDTALPLLEDLASRKDADGKIRSRARFFSGLVFFYQGEDASALAVFRDITSADDGGGLFPYALFYSGAINYRLARRKEAERLFGLLLESGTKNALLVDLGRFYLYLLTGDEKMVRPLFSAPPGPPLDQWLNALQVRLCLAEGRDGELLETLEKGLSSGSNRDFYYRTLYVHHLRKNNTDKAQNYLKKLLEEFPFSPFAREARFNLGLLLFRDKEYEQAEKLFREIPVPPEDTALSLRLSFFQGEIRLEAGDYRNAETFFLECRKSGGRNSPFFMPSVRRLSGIYILQGEHGKNTELLRSIRPGDDRELQYNLAVSHTALQQPNAAQELLTDILEHDPAPELEQKAYLLLHFSATNRKEEKPAASYVFKMRGNRFFSPEVFVRCVVDLSRLYFQKARYRESVNMLLQIVGPDLAADSKITVNGLLYENYRDLKEWEKARLILDNLIKLDPDNGDYIRERERIKDL